MSEAELHILRGRLHQGQLNKARRGELFNHAPIGYVRLPTGEMVLDPDEQVQAVVRLVFETFEELGSQGALLRYLVRHGIRLGVRSHSGPTRGQLQWRRPCRGTLSRMLHHPIYAGAYSYGRRPTDPRRKVAGRPSTGRIVAPLEKWAVLQKNRLPAYITWERWEANQRQLAANQARAFARGTPREGSALLGGLLRCGHCGSRMLVAYIGPKAEPRYTCQRQQLEYAESPCQSVTGWVLDELVSQQALAVLEPASVELSLRAAEDLQEERDRLHQQWQQRLERIGYEVQRAARQYQAVEPENRLVARELERRWEQALLEQHRIEEDYARFCREQPAALTGEERAAILALAADIPRLWHASQTSPVPRKTILGYLMEKVIITVQGETERVDVTIHWAGGFTSQHELVRPVARYEQLIRPIWHQKTDRVLGHILICFLAYVLWKTLAQWMRRSGLGDAPRTVLDELAKIKSGDVLLPIVTREGQPAKTIRLRCVTQPDPAQKVLLNRLGIELPHRLRRFDEVVQM